MTPYLLDTNFFIQSHRTGNPLDVAESFWKKVKALAESKKIASIDKVKKEIYDSEDELKAWCAANLANDFFRDSSSVLNSYSQIAAWAVSKSAQYKPQALNIFLDADEADAWLVAYAFEQKLKVVTNEVSAPYSKNSIKIPDVCIAFGVPFLNPMEMFREMGERY